MQELLVKRELLFEELHLWPFNSTYLNIERTIQADDSINI